MTTKHEEKVILRWSFAVAIVVGGAFYLFGVDPPNLEVQRAVAVALGVFILIQMYVTAKKRDHLEMFWFTVFGVVCLAYAYWYDWPAPPSLPAIPGYDPDPYWDR